MSIDDKLHNVHSRDFFEDISFQIEGGKSRWYRNSVFPGSEEYTEHDGDSLFLKYKTLDKQLIDGKDLDDVGNFVLNNNTYRCAKLENGHNAIIFTYNKTRDLSENTVKLEIKLGIIDEDNSTESLDCKIHTLYSSGATKGKFMFPNTVISNEELGVNDLRLDLKKYGIESVHDEFTKSYVQDKVSMKYNKNSLDYVKGVRKIDEDNFLAIHLHETGSSGYDTAVLVNRTKGMKEITNTKRTQGYLHLEHVMKDYDVKKIIENW